MFYSVIRIQGDNTVSATKAIIETHVVENVIRFNPIMIRNDTTDSITE